MSEFFSVTVLGSNSALPSSKKFPSAQMLNASGHLFLIDCGEGTQIQIRKYKHNFMRINNVFISHLHGDHCFGLIGLISTLGLFGRKNDLYIHAHSDLEMIMKPQLDYFCSDLPFNVVFKNHDPKKAELIFENKTISVETIPLKHRVPTCGFLFREKEKPLKLKKSFVFEYKPSIKQMLAVKKGDDFVTDDGVVLENSKITEKVQKPRSYAYCSDTAYLPKICEQISGIDTLYHETTFLEEKRALATKTCHSTARDAALIASQANVKRLLIGHFSSRYSNYDLFLDEAKKEFSNTLIANEGLTIDI